MATAGSEVTTSRIRPPAQSDYNRSIVNSEVISLEEAFHPRGAVPALPPARALDHIVSCILENHPLDRQACRDILGESSLSIHCLGLPYMKPSSHPNSSEIAKETVSINDEPTGEPTHIRYNASLPSTTQTTRYFGYLTSIPSKICHRWLGSLLGLSTLTLAVVSLLMYTVRSYRMAVWTTRNDELQACTGLIQAGRPIGPNCERIISEGPQDPPYNLSRRMTQTRGPGSFFNLSDISVGDSDLFRPVETRHSAWLVFASIFALISLADLILCLLSKRFRTEDDLESLAAIELATPLHHNDRTKIMDTDHFDAWQPGAHIHPPMEIRRRIRVRRGDQQEVQREISVEAQPLGMEDVPYSIARYLDQPPHPLEKFFASQ